MTRVFISYSQNDSDKVKLLEFLLKENGIKPIIIANDRIPLKPLEEKVIEGILKCDIIIPILSKRSFKTQWINQEIGFAKAIDKAMFPIVEKSLIRSLKGFIHKDLDLPYSFESENFTSFEDAVKNLIEDIHELVDETEFDESEIENPLSVQSDALLEEIKLKRKLSIRIREILESQEGELRAKSEVNKLINILKSKANKLIETGYRVLASENSNEYYYEINVESMKLYCSLEIMHQQYILTVRNDYEDEIGRSYSFEYSFSLDENLNNCWKITNDNFKTYTENIAEMFFRHLTIELSKKESQKGSP